MNVTRKATERDIDSLAHLFNEYRIFYKKLPDLEGARKFIAERMLNKESEILVAENAGGVIMGFVQLYPIFSSTRMKRMCLLNDLFIHPDFRRKGISIGLIEACKKLCLDTGSCGMILETAKDNIIGNTLYIKTGFSLDVDHNFYEWENRF